MELSTGRVIDLSCPISDMCFANQGCVDECPSTGLDVLIRCGDLEHDLNLLPHNDPEIKEVCRKCGHQKLKDEMLIGYSALTPNELRSANRLRALPDVDYDVVLY